ncbi:MAG: flagellin [Synergistaceae bacterium]|nr:flagellin [Synergistaceae bacterium]
MRIYHNIPALTAYNALNSTNNAMEKTIQKLSTGLRINSAADDAAGFAISEKMRSQISGLEVAIRNTQDATSMLQVAEGALGETNSMLQRMRELSVQASNDTLTSQDRSYIQLEIDQLKDQIDRIANTTQFNKKRLLDGSSAGITSSSNLSVKAYVRGSLREIDQFGQKKSFEGNYKITVNVDPSQTGSGQVQKSSIMTIKHPNVITDVQVVNDNGIEKVAVDNLPAGDYSVNGAARTGAAAKLTGVYGLGASPEEIFGIDPTAGTNNITNNASVLFEVVSVGTDSVTLKATSNVLTTDGTVKNYLEDNIVVTGATTYLGEKLGIGDDTVDTSTDPSTTTSAISMTLDTDQLANVSVGDKFVYNFKADVQNAASGADIQVSATQDQDWPYKWDTYAISDENGDYTAGGTVDFAIDTSEAAPTANKEIHLRNFYLNGENGTVYEGDIILTTNSDFENYTSADDDKLASFTAAYIGKTATGDTKLRDLNTFWNSSGVFMLETPQTITISQGDGKTATVTLYATDTLHELENKFNYAIGTDLGQAKYVTGDGASKFCTFVEKSTADSQGLETVGGTFMFRSILPGDRGNLTFSGDEDLINTFALNVVKESSTPAFRASIYDAHSGTPVATNIKVADNRLIGVLHPNVDIEFDAMANVKAQWSDEEKNFILQPDDGSYEAVIHIVDSSTVFQIGANEGEDIAIDIGNMSSGALGVNAINVSTRESASKAIGIIDAAINTVSSQRAKIGAYQNALEYTSENLTTTMTNLTAAESRIRDTDMAATMMEFVKLQILNQSGTSMLAQANQLPQSVLSLLQ